MLIRRVQTRSHPDSDSDPYTSFHLVRSVRSGDAVRDVTLLNLGDRFAVPPAQWPDLCSLVESLRSGQDSLFDPDPELLEVARQIAERLDSIATPDPAGKDLADVNLDSLTLQQMRSVGAERIVLQALQDLDFIEALEDIGISSSDARIATALVVARMLHPSSASEAHAWLTGRSAAFELLGLDTSQPPSLSTLHRISELLWLNRAALETVLFQRERDLLQILDTIAFFDLTNVQCHSHAQQERHDGPPVTLALNAAGFPSYSEILPSNISEPATLTGTIERLAALCADQPLPTVVLDASSSTQATRAWLRERGYDWISVRRDAEAPLTDETDLACSSGQETQTAAWRLRRVEDESELYVWSDERQARNESIQVEQRQRFEAALRALHEGLNKKGGRKRYDKVVERLGRLKERYSQVSGQYTIEIERSGSASASAAGTTGKTSGTAEPSGHSTATADSSRTRKRPERAVAVHFQHNGKDAAHAGAYVLRTSHVDWGIERVVRLHRQFTDIEATFRSLEAEIGTLPVGDTFRNHSGSHVFIGILAYHAVHLVRHRLREQGITDSWTTIRHKLAGWGRLTTTLETAAGEHIVCQQDTRPTPEAAALARAAGVTPGLHRVRTRTPAD